MKLTDSTLPALNDADLRDKQMKRFTEGIGKLGDYADALKNTQKWSMRISLVYVALFIILILVIVGSSAWRGGGLAGFVDLGQASRHFNCTSGEYHDDVRIYADAQIFNEMYGGTCRLWHKE